MFSLFTPFIVLLAILLFNSIRILKEYERGVVFFLGKFNRQVGTS